MTFGEKLQAIRKNQGLSQERLAEELGVSRQAVSKWENDQGYPETETLLRLSSRFGVSLDSLLKEDTSEETAAEPGYYVSRETADGYLAFQDRAGKSIASGTALIILSTCFGFLPNDDVGGILTLMGVAIGVAVMVAQGLRRNPYRKMQEQPLCFDGGTLQELRRDEERLSARYKKMTVSAIILLFLTVAMGVLADEVLLIPEGIWGPVFMALIAAAVWMLIYAGMMSGSYEFLTENAAHWEEKRHGSGWLYGTTQALAGCLYVAMGMLWGQRAWAVGWVLFPMAAILVYLVVRIRRKNSI